MSRLISFFWGASFLAFLAVFLFVYAYSPEQLAVISDPDTGQDVLISRENFFYFGIIGFVIWNGAILTLAKVLQMLGVSNQNFFSSSSFKQNLIDWVYSFGLVVNAYFITMTLFLSFYNSTESRDMENVGILLYIGPILIVAWLFILLVLLLRRK